MLTGATSIIGGQLGVNMLPRLQLSSRKLLEWLHLDAYFSRYGPILNIPKALADCKQLKDLQICCNSSDCTLPELDLQHLVRLRRCRLYCLPAPCKLTLPPCKVELTLFARDVAAWSKLWPRIKDHVCSITVGGEPYHATRVYSYLVLYVWPEGIEAFRGLKFLQMHCEAILPHKRDGALDLDHLAYIPHVSLRSKGKLDVKISAGSWNLLDLQSIGSLNVAINNVEAFLKGTRAFHFVYASRRKPQDLIQTLTNAAGAIGKALYEHNDTYSPYSKGHNCERDWPLVELSNCKPDPDRLSCGDAFLDAFAAYKRSMHQW